MHRGSFTQQTQEELSLWPPPPRPKQRKQVKFGSNTVVIIAPRPSGDSSQSSSTCPLPPQTESVQSRSSSLDSKEAPMQTTTCSSSESQEATPVLEETPIQEEEKCALCAKSGELVPVGKISVHLQCALWTPEICCDGETGELLHVEDALERSREIKCARCRLPGASIGCVSASCQRSYHYDCIVEEQQTGATMSKSNFSIRCPIHSPGRRKRQRKAEDSAE